MTYATRQFTEVEAAAFYSESDKICNAMDKLPAKQRVRGNAKYDKLATDLRNCYLKHKAVKVVNDIVRKV